jgi:chlorite dismutase
MTRRLFSFVGGASGRWQVTRMAGVVGAPLESVPYLDIVEDDVPQGGAVWVLRGVTSYARYVNTAEKHILKAMQAGLDRPEATCAALIPVKKSAAWWELAADERRAILEERSRHIQIGLEYLPAVARRLHHSYDMGEPFDFLTWFEYAPEHAEAFEQLTGRLRESEEWQYVEREVDMRLLRG